MKNKDEKLNQTFFVKTGFIGLLVFLLFMGATPAKAHQVIEGAIPASNAEYLIGVKYRSFGNGPDPQALIGLTPLGWGNRIRSLEIFPGVKSKRIFSSSPMILYKGIISTVIFRIDSSNYKSSIFTYPIPADLQSPFHDENQHCLRRLRSQGGPEKCQVERNPLDPLRRLHGRSPEPAKGLDGERIRF